MGDKRLVLEGLKTKEGVFEYGGSHDINENNLHASAHLHASTHVQVERFELQS